MKGAAPTKQIVPELVAEGSLEGALVCFRFHMLRLRVRALWEEEDRMLEMSPSVLQAVASMLCIWRRRRGAACCSVHGYDDFMYLAAAQSQPPLEQGSPVLEQEFVFPPRNWLALQSTA